MRMCGIEAALSYQAEAQPDPTDPSEGRKARRGVTPTTSARVTTVARPSPILMQISNMRGRSPRARAAAPRARAA